MSSTRDSEQSLSLSREICIAFFEEYLIHRGTYWDSTWQAILSKFINRPKERQTVCKEFIDRIRTATSLDEKESIIKDLGIAARCAQGEKIQSDNKSYFAYAWNNFFGLFVKDNSLFAKTCHAVRTCMVADILLSGDKQLHLDKIQQLHIELKNKNDTIKYNSTHMLDATKLKEERNNLYYQLLDMHDPKLLEDATIWEKFPPSLPYHDAAILKLPKGVKPNPNSPLVYDIHYGAIFLENEIKSVPKREHDFNEQVKIAVGQNRHTNPENILRNVLNAAYFVPVDFEKQLIQEYTPTSDNQESKENDGAVKPDLSENTKEPQSKHEQSSATQTEGENPNVSRFGIFTSKPKDEGKKKEDMDKENKKEKDKSRKLSTGGTG